MAEFGIYSKYMSEDNTEKCGQMVLIVVSAFNNLYEDSGYQAVWVVKEGYGRILDHRDNCNQCHDHPLL